MSGAGARGPALLCLSYDFPPRPGTGPARLDGLTRTLAARGWDVRVITVRSLRSQRGWRDEPVAGREVLRVPHLNPPVHAWRDRGGWWGALGVGLDGLLPLDVTCPWTAGAVLTGLASLRRRPADLLLASSPPASSALAGLALARATGLPWVWDLRDPWAQNPLADRPAYSGPLGPLHRALEARAEAACLAAARQVWVTSQSLATELTGRTRPGAGPELVRNGFDPALRLPGAPPPPRRLPAADRPLRLLYPGAVIPGSGYSPLELLTALDRLVAERGLGPAALSVRLLTSHPGWLRAWADEHPALAPCLSLEPLRSREEARAAYAEADALLLGYPDYPGVPGKAYEYMATGKPVLLVAPRGEVRDLLERAGVALSAEPGDPAGQRAALVQLLDGLRAGARLTRPDWAFVDGFAAPRQWERAAGLLEGLVAERGAL